MIFLRSFLPGSLILARSSASDYSRLHRFHYIPRKPATFSDVWSIHFAPVNGPKRLAAVAVLSWPSACCLAREVHFGLRERSYREKVLFANANLRTISRVIVHPQFRSLGLAAHLVRCLCANATSRYVEASAIMAHAHPFFRKGGMKQINHPLMKHAVYFLFDRQTSAIDPFYLDPAEQEISHGHST